MKSRKVSISDVISVSRLDGKFHNAEVNIYDSLIRKHSSHTLGDLCTDVFTSSRGKRMYTSREYGYPYLSNSDMLAVDPYISCNFMSRKYGYEEKALLKEGMIVTGRVGAIGQIAFVPGFWEDMCTMGSDNIFRICLKESIRKGFVYAYLASKVGYLSFWKLATGGVQPYVTDGMIRTIAIPNFPEDLQEQIDELIWESARLKGEAYKVICKAHEIIESNIGKIPSSTRCGSVGNQRLCSMLHKRFEASYHVGEKRDVEEFIKCKFSYVTLDSLCSSIFKPNIFKRSYVSSNGYQLLGGADMMKAVPRIEKLISRHQVQSMPELLLKDGWILITRAGTIGNTMYADSILSSQIVSEDVLRVVPKEKSDSGYVYAYLTSSYGQKNITLYTYGSVIQHIEAEHLRGIPIPIIGEDARNEIDKLMGEYVKMIEDSKSFEIKAINLVEDEISKWTE